MFYQWRKVRKTETLMKDGETRIMQKIYSRGLLITHIITEKFLHTGAKAESINSRFRGKNVVFFRFTYAQNKSKLHATLRALRKLLHSN